MRNTLLYSLTVLIWGSTWLAIEFQLGEVAVEVSLVYRFALAGLLIIAISVIKRLRMKFSLLDHGYFALLGLLNFSFNYLFLYKAQESLTSAMSSVAFSLLLIVNILNTRLFFGKTIELKTYVGAALGIFGVTALFWPELTTESASSDMFYGIALVFVGILVASWGNMVSVRNSNHKLPVFQGSGYGMLYGTISLLLYANLTGAEFNLSSHKEYWLSLTYLSVFGTVVAFYCYFELLKNIGPEKASYSIVLFPVVAVTLSTLFEGFVWSTFTVSGFLLVIVGNLVVLLPQQNLVKIRHHLKLPQPELNDLKKTINPCDMQNIASQATACLQNEKLRQPS